MKPPAPRRAASNITNSTSVTLTSPRPGPGHGPRRRPRALRTHPTGSLDSTVSRASPAPCIRRSSRAPRGLGLAEDQQRPEHARHRERHVRAPSATSVSPSQASQAASSFISISIIGCITIYMQINLTSCSVDSNGHGASRLVYYASSTRTSARTSAHHASQGGEADPTTTSPIPSW